MNNFIIVQINKGKSEFQNTIKQIEILLQEKKHMFLLSMNLT